MSPSKSIHRDYHSSGDKREGNHADIRNLPGEQKKDMQRLCESIDRGRQVVKTCSVHTAALPTVVYRYVKSKLWENVFGGLLSQ